MFYDTSHIYKCLWQRLLQFLNKLIMNQDTNLSLYQARLGYKIRNHSPLKRSYPTFI